MKNNLSIVIFIVSFLCINRIAYSQGENAVLFSECGDTVLTRTSCYCKTKDTLWSTFTVLENIGGSYRLLSVFYVKEPGKISIPCADFKLVPRDTIEFYGFKNVGWKQKSLENYRIVSEIESIKKGVNNKGDKVYIRFIRHQFQLDKETFHTVTVFDVVKKKREKITIPKTKNIFGAPSLNKYHFEIIVNNQLFNAEDGSIRTIISHEKIGN